MRSTSWTCADSAIPSSCRKHSRTLCNLTLDPAHPLRALLNQLRDRSMLLVLDHCEPVIDAVALPASAKPGARRGLSPVHAKHSPWVGQQTASLGAYSAQLHRDTNSGTSTRQ
jgi:hypothetical protein